MRNNQTCVVNSNKYVGEYVAMPDFQDRRVIAHDSNPHRVIKKAKKKGYINPVIIKIPEKEMVTIYHGHVHP